MPVRFEFVEVQELKRSGMRQLLARDARCTNVEEWLDRLQDEFREINLPFTAANGSILIDILSEKYNFSPVNRAVLMEQFVDFTLRKTAIEQSRRETFDYTNKTDLLSHLASWMARHNVYIPSKEELRTGMRNYIDTRGLKVDIDDVMNEFLAARIFVARGESSICFRYRGVLEYFIALRMTVDPAFKEWVMEESRYLGFLSEIQYYGGKVRNDSDILDLVGNRHASLLALVVAESGTLDLSQFDKLQLPTDDEGAALSAQTNDILRPPLLMGEKDDERNTELVADADDRQDVIRAVAVDASDKLTASLLLYSGLIKNMELIQDADKRRHLGHIWRSWGINLIDALRFAPKLAKDRRLRINGALYEVRAPQGMSYPTLLRKLLLLLPHVSIRMLSGALGTEKLERQLTEPTSEAEEPNVVALLRTGLIADLGLPATPSAITKLTERFKNHKYLLWSLIVHVSELRRLDRIKADHVTLLERPLAGAIAQLKGGTNAERETEKRRQLARLTRDRVVLRLKRDHDRKQ